MDNNNLNSGTSSLEIRRLFQELLELDNTSPNFFQKILLLQDELILIDSHGGLTQDQKKALQLELSCIEDHIALFNLSRDLTDINAPSKELLIKIKYAKDDIHYCMQSLHSLFLNMHA